jgi:nitronate monooxygenase
MLRATRALTDRPFQANVFCHRPAVADAPREAAWLDRLAPLFAEFGATPPQALREIYASFVGNDAMLAVLLEERPAVVSFHFGLPDAAALGALRDRGIVTLATATSPDEALRIERAGVDAVVAQGIEAGGHRGVFDPRAHDPSLGTFALVRLLVRQSSLPVIAAGGIMDGAGLAAALRLGACAAQMGTAFIACPESSASAAWRERLLGPRAHDTRLTSAISGRPARGIANRMYALGEATALPDYPIAYDAAKALHAAASAQGCHAFAAHWAGQGAPLARAIPAAGMVRLLVDEWRAAEAGSAES